MCRGVAIFGVTGRRGGSCSKVVQDGPSNTAGLLQRDPEAVRRYADLERETSRSRRGEKMRTTTFDPSYPPICFVRTEQMFHLRESDTGG